MKSLEITVGNNDLPRLKSLLNELDYITIIKERDKGEDEWVSFVSEPALAEDWESDEDSRYEKYLE